MKGDNAMNIIADLVSVPEAAKMLNVDRTRVNILCRQGRFDGAAKIGRNWVIPRVSVENFKRLPPGGRRNIKYQTEEDKALIAEALEATNSAPNENIARSEER